MAKKPTETTGADDVDEVDTTDSLFADSAFEPPLPLPTEEERRIPTTAVVSKCAASIHMACRSHSKLKLSQRRALNLFQHMTLYDMRFDPIETLHQASLNVLAWAMTGDSRASRNWGTLVPDLRELVTIRSEMDVLGVDGKIVGWEAMTIISRITILDISEVVYWRNTPEYQDLLGRNSKVVEFALLQQLRFRSVHSLTLYEHARYYTDVGVTPWLLLDQLRAILNLKGRKYYMEFRRLAERVITPAVKEINDVSDIAIRVQVQRKDRGEVVAIRFVVALKAGADALVGASPTEDATTGDQLSTVIAHDGSAAALAPNISPQPTRNADANVDDLLAQMRLAEFAVPTHRVPNLIREHGPSAIIADLDAADTWLASQEAQQTPIRSKAAVALSAIREHWGKASIASVADSSTDGQKPTIETSARPRQDTKPRATRGTLCTQYIEGLLITERIATLAAFEVHLRHPQRSIIRDAYRVHGLNSRVVLAELHAFLTSIGVLGAAEGKGPEPARRREPA